MEIPETSYMSTVEIFVFDRNTWNQLHVMCGQKWVMLKILICVRKKILEISYMSTVGKKISKVKKNTAGEEARWQLHKNVASNIEQVLVATPHKAPNIRPSPSHHENYPS